jgi:signal transduction histidine kinase
MQILLIEDNPDHADLVMECAQQAYNGCAQITWHTELLPALELLKAGKSGDQTLDLCLSDLQLPDSSVAETIACLKELETKVPIVVLTSLHDEDKAKILIQGGAQDYLSKEDLNDTVLYRTCTYAIERRHQTVLLEERNRDQAAFCYSLSHDFKGPLRRIGTALKFLKEDLSKRVEFTSEELDHFSTLDNNISAVNTLVSDLYQYLILDNEREDFCKVDLSEIAYESQSLLNTDNTDALKIHITSLPIVEGSRSQLVLLFKNLLDNSIKYCRDRPNINLRLEASSNDRYAVISIADNGVGIDPSKIDSIFRPFQRLHVEGVDPGSGLGLSIVKRIVDNHSGTIRLDSKVGQGTTVFISLPYYSSLAS